MPSRSAREHAIKSAGVWEYLCTYLAIIVRVVRWSSLDTRRCVTNLDKCAQELVTTTSGREWPWWSTLQVLNSAHAIYRRNQPRDALWLSLIRLHRQSLPLSLSHYYTSTCIIWLLHALAAYQLQKIILNSSWEGFTRSALRLPKICCCVALIWKNCIFSTVLLPVCHLQKPDVRFLQCAHG